MTTLLAVAALTAGAMVRGVMTSRKQRRVDHRHYAAFIGFVSGIIAVSATSLCVIAADLQPHSMNPTVQGFEFVTGIIAVLSIGITFLLGVGKVMSKTYTPRKIREQLLSCLSASPQEL